MTKQATSEQRAEEARQIITESLEQAFRRLAVQKPPPPDIDISGRLGEVLRRAEEQRASQADEYVVGSRRLCGTTFSRACPPFNAPSFPSQTATSRATKLQGSPSSSFNGTNTLIL